MTSNIDGLPTSWVFLFWLIAVGFYLRAGALFFDWVWNGWRDLFRQFFSRKK